VAGSCEHGNKPSCSIKCREFLDRLSVLLASQEGLCSMELEGKILLGGPRRIVKTILKLVLSGIWTGFM
jgi:hypothetical protein